MMPGGRFQLYPIIKFLFDSHTWFPSPEKVACGTTRRFLKQNPEKIGHCYRKPAKNPVSKAAGGATGRLDKAGVWHVWLKWDFCNTIFFLGDGSARHCNFSIALNSYPIRFLSIIVTVNIPLNPYLYGHIHSPFTTKPLTTSLPSSVLLDTAQAAVKSAREAEEAVVSRAGCGCFLMGRNSDLTEWSNKHGGIHGKYIQYFVGYSWLYGINRAL